MLLRSATRLAVLIALVATVLVVNAAPGAAAATCFGRSATIVATPGVETNGTSGADVIVGTSGDDVINGNGGSDRICAGSGDDVVRGGSGRDRIDLGSGNDVGHGGPGQDRLLGRRGSDRLFGNGNDDLLKGGSGQDRLVGGPGDDDLSGNGSKDQLLGGRGRDRLDGGARSDVLMGGAGPDALYGRSGRDTLDGEAGTDDCQGGTGRDQLVRCENPDTDNAVPDDSVTDDTGTGDAGDPAIADEPPADDEPAPNGGGGSEPPTALDELRLTFENDVLGTYGGSFPWLHQGWNRLGTNGDLRIEDLPGNVAGQVASSCRYSSAALGSCDLTILTMDVDNLESINTMIHELAHVYERSTGVLVDPAPMGMAQLYFNVEWGATCNAAEVFADTLLSVTKPGAYLAYYRGACPALASSTGGTPTAEAQAVMNSLLAGNDPAWFAATYANGAEAWADIMTLGTGERLRIITNLAGEFGGYCSEANTMQAGFFGGSDTNPWADDGC